MIYQSLAKCVLDRLKADIGTGGIYQGGGWTLVDGAYNNLASPARTQRPYIVYTFSSEKDDSQTSDEEIVTVTFNIYHEATVGTDLITAIIDRLHGDAILQAGRIPTFGFHRHIMVLPTNGYNAQATECLRQSVDVGPLDTSTVIATVIYEFRISAQAVSP